jgi:hypothetical protein
MALTSLVYFATFFPPKELFFYYLTGLVNIHIYCLLPCERVYLLEKYVWPRAEKFESYRIILESKNGRALQNGEINPAQNKE